MISLNVADEEEEPVADLNVEMFNKAEEEAVANQADIEHWNEYGAYTGWLGTRLRADVCPWCG